MVSQLMNCKKQEKALSVFKTCVKIILNNNENNARIFKLKNNIYVLAETSKVEAPKADSSKKPLGKLTCEDFIAVEDIIKPQYVIAGNAYTKGGKAKNAVIEIIDTETLVPILVEECQKAPKESFWAKLKSKLKL